MIDESRLNTAEKLLLKMHRNFIARANATGAEYDRLVKEMDEIGLEVWDCVATFPRIPPTSAEQK